MAVKTVYDVIYKCFGCGETIEAQLDKSPVGSVPGKCSRCGGGAMMIESVQPHSVTWIDPNIKEEDDDKPRRGRPPKIR